MTKPVENVIGKSISINGKLMDLSTPKVMGILNVTPDSFYPESRIEGREALRGRVEMMMSEGVDIFDLGGYSTRPGASEVSEEEEYRRLAWGLEEIRSIYPDAVISVDTFRSGVARRCVEEWGVQIINDIGGGTLDDRMFETIADLKVAYVLMHTRGTPATMTQLTHYDDVVAEVVRDLAFKASELRKLGVCDIILDPGFGFAKDVEGNFQLLNNLDQFGVMGLPLLAGLSRKSMIWRLLGITPEEALNGTTALNMVALMKGADILRVHDVKEGKECVRLYEQLTGEGREL